MVMDMIHAGDVMESNETYQSPLDSLFDRLHKKNPDHIAYRYYEATKELIDKHEQEVYKRHD